MGQARAVPAGSQDSRLDESSTHCGHLRLEESGAIAALVMELVEGEDLSQRIARGAIPLDDALPIARQIAEALEAAHEQGIIHRDLKPVARRRFRSAAMNRLVAGLYSS